MSDQVDSSIPFSPIVPPSLSPPIVAEGDVEGEVGAAEGDVEGEVGVAEGDLEGEVGAAEGDVEGEVGAAEGDLEGEVGAAEGDLEGEVGAAEGDEGDEDEEEGDEDEEEGDEEEDSDEDGGGSDVEEAEFGGWAQPRGRKKKKRRGRKTHKCSAPNCNLWFSFGTTIGRRAFYTHVDQVHGKDFYICSSIPCLQVSPTKKSAETHRESTKRKHGRAFHPSELLKKNKKM